jgi:ClpP class serine protease
VIDVDSPGGTYPGIPELGKEIYEARGAKGKGNIVAVANSLAASGALWLATAFDRFVITPSGEAGSIGAVSVHTELSRAFEEAGWTNTVFRQPPAKAERNMYEALTEEAKEYAQRIIDEVYGEFVSAVARHRSVKTSVVRSNFGQGRLLGAKDAVSAGMADGVSTMGQVLAKLSGGRGRGSRTRAEDESRPVYTETRHLRRRRANATG